MKMSALGSTNDIYWGFVPSNGRKIKNGVYCGIDAICGVVSIRIRYI